MRGLPVFFRCIALPANDVQVFPRAVLATGKIGAIKNPQEAGFKLNSHAQEKTSSEEKTMSELRNFEISYTKDGERKTFVHQADHFYTDDEWQAVVQRFGIPMKDQAWGSQTRQTFKTMCIDSGYTDVSYTEIP